MASGGASATDGVVQSDNKGESEDPYNGGVGMLFGDDNSACIRVLQLRGWLGGAGTGETEREGVDLQGE